MSAALTSLLAIASYGEAHGTELMETLYQYLQYAGAANRADSELCLHKNSMLYRLGRIRELLAPGSTKNRLTTSNFC